MHRQMLKSKIHRAVVTGCDVDYVGSITIDAELMSSADLLEGEHSPIDVRVDRNNEIHEIDSHPEVLLDSSLASDSSIGSERVANREETVR